MLTVYKVKIREIVKEIIGKGLTKELRHLIEDMLIAEKSTNERMSLLTYEVFDKTDPELGIGQDYTWQVSM